MLARRHDDSLLHDNCSPVSATIIIARLMGDNDNFSPFGVIMIIPCSSA
jgi:hypothetical protein